MDTPLVQNYRAVLRKYADFEGRAARSEYWYFTLGNIIINILLGFLGFIGKILSPLFALIILVPSIAVGARRLHDTNRSGWWLLLALVPVIGWIVLLVFMVTDSEAGTNKYGPNPKGIPSTSPSTVSSPAP